MLAGNSVSEGMIWEKARRLHDDLVKKYPSTSGDTDVFKASRGWFEKFKKRSGIHSMVRHGEAASANQKAVEEFVQDFSDYVKANGFNPQQMFNCDENGLFWKKNVKEDIYHGREESITGTQINWGQTDSFTMWKCKWGLQDQAITRVPLGE